MCVTVHDSHQAISDEKFKYKRLICSGSAFNKKIKEILEENEAIKRYKI
jgi:hypothetical protein